MKHLDFYNFKLNHIRIFLFAAKYGNYSRAAQELNITQSMVTKTIHSIEQQFGIILFVRSHNNMQLTPAGRVLYKQWTNIISSFEDSIQEAHFAQTGSAKQLTIGISYLSVDSLIRDLIDKCTQADRDVEINMEFYSMAESWEKLENNEVDAILTSMHEMTLDRKKEFSYVIFQKAYNAVFISKSNPLSQKEKIEYSDLKKESFIALSENSDKCNIKSLEWAGKMGGFTPAIACYVPNGLSIKPLLIANKGIAIADSLSGFEGDQVKMFILDNAFNYRIIVWRKSFVPEWADDFLKKLSSGEQIEKDIPFWNM